MAARAPDVGARSDDLDHGHLDSALRTGLVWATVVTYCFLRNPWLAHLATVKGDASQSRRVDCRCGGSLGHFFMHADLARIVIVQGQQREKAARSEERRGGKEGRAGGAADG